MLTFCGCDEPKSTNDDGTPTIVMPDSTTAATVNGYKQTTDKSQTDNTAEEIETNYTAENNSEVVKSEPSNGDTNIQNNDISASYAANKSTKKFHKSSCGYAKNIKSENLYTTDSRDELINSGYESCKKCKP